VQWVYRGAMVTAVVANARGSEPSAGKRRVAHSSHRRLERAQLTPLANGSIEGEGPRSPLDCLLWSSDRTRNRVPESEESQDCMQQQPLKSDKRRNVEVSLLRSINTFYQAVMARSSVLRLMLTFGLTEFGICLPAGRDSCARPGERRRRLYRVRYHRDCSCSW
jgi:hypothetical protein